MTEKIGTLIREHVVVRTSSGWLQAVFVQEIDGIKVYGSTPIESRTLEEAVEVAHAKNQEWTVESPSKPQHDPYAIGGNT